jgi:hypothetical protein
MPRTSGVSLRALIRRTIGSSTALAVLGLAALVTLNELSRLVGEVLAADGHTHSIAAVIGLGAGAELEAWPDWRSAAFSPMALIIAHCLADLLFITAYGVLAYRLIRYAERARGGSADRALVLLYSVVAFDLLEDGLVALLVLSGSTSLPIVLALAVYAKWAAAFVLVLYCVLSTRVGGALRGAISTALLALYAQRLSALVVAAVGALTLISADGVLEQLPDVYRGWLQYPASGFAGIPSLDLAAIFFSTGAFLLTGLSIFALGRQRARQYRRRDSLTEDRPDAATWPWLAVAGGTAVVALAVSLVTAGRSVDWPTALVFVGVIVVIAAGSALMRRRAVALSGPVLTSKLDGRATAVRRCGDLLVMAWIAIWALGPFKALLSALLLAASGSFAGSRFSASLWSLLVIEVTLPVVAVVCVVAARRWLDSAPRQRAARSRSAVVAAAFSDLAPDDERVAASLRAAGRWVVAISVLLIVVLLLFPRAVASALGPVAVLVLLVGCWTTLLGALILALGQRKPLEVFQLLRLRATPVVTLLVLLPIVVSLVEGAPALHAIRTAPAGAFAERDTLRTGFTAWYERQDCALTLPGSDVSVAPLLLVAAQGGGIRAATWTVDVLRELPRDGACAAGATLLSSGASGGSIGIASFQQRANATASSADLDTTALGGPGALAAGIAGLLGGDLVGSVTGIRVPSPTDYADLLGAWTWQDRTALQEATWAEDAPQFAQPYSVEPQAPTGYAVLNTTDSISNCKVVVSQLDLRTQVSAESDTVEGPSVPACNGPDAELANTVDLQDYLGNCIFSLDWATAAELSARFPVLSPAGRISNATLPADCNAVSDMQLVDGGLTDNTALGTIADLAPELVQLVTATNAQANGADRPYVVPIVMYISNNAGADVTATPDGTRPEALIPLTSLLQAPLGLLTAQSWLTRLSTQLGNVCPATDLVCAAALAELREQVPQGVAVVQPSTAPSVSVPLGWTLSSFSRTRLRLEAETQAECGKTDSTVQCFTGGGYGRLGDVLDLFADD